MTPPLVLAYSGGAASTSAIGWLMGRHDAEIVAVILDLGQGSELEEVRDRALAHGASRAHVLDLREEFAREFILPTLRAGVMGVHVPMVTELGRPLIARTLLEIADIEGSTTVAHACGEEADRLRFETALRSINPVVRIVAPSPTGSHRANAGADANLWGRIVAASLPPDAVRGPTEPPVHVEIAFEQGTPTAMNGVSLTLAELIESLSIIAARRGLGRLQVVGNASDHGDLRTIEAPAAVVLHAAHRAVEASTLPPDLLQRKLELASRYSGVVESGTWFGPMRAELEVFSRKLQQRVTGVARMTLSQDNIHTEGGIDSPVLEVTS